jgi:uncharacterized membrane protein
MTFFGRLHPLLVHLPIGFLVIACIFDWLSFLEDFKKLKRATRLALLLGWLAALASCITGYLLSQSGEYDSTLVARHQWLGISTMATSFVYWQAKKRKTSALISKLFAVTTLLLLSATGHLGGSLTHGENYLTESLSQENAKVDLSSVDLEKAVYYRDLVQPILSTRCYSCHGESKQKGKLRLDQPDYILKGGKHEKTVVASHPDESEMINRLLLPLTEKNHMPPKEKPQPSPAEIAVLKDWIELGADFSKSVQALGATSRLQKLLTLTPPADNDLEEEVNEADESILTQLRKHGVVIQEIADGNHHLTANVINAQPMDSAIALLPGIKEQLVWLKANSSKITDHELEAISKVTALRKLDLSHTTISSDGIAKLTNLPHLTSLNLSNTGASNESVKQLTSITALKELFLFNTKVTESELAKLRKEFSAITFEIGNYSVPTLATDTTIVKAPKQ